MRCGFSGSPMVVLTLYMLKCPLCEIIFVSCLGRDVHETFNAETETRHETQVSETETRPRH